MGHDGDGLRRGVAAPLSADSSLLLPDSSQARRIRPYPCPIRPFLGFVACGLPVELYNPPKEVARVNGLSTHTHTHTESRS